MHPGQADVILANSKFTARVFQAHLPSIRAIPRVVYPGINISAYEVAETLDTSDPDVLAVISCVNSYSWWRQTANAACEVQRPPNVSFIEPLRG